MPPEESIAEYGRFGKRKYIGYKGDWYDITDFIKRHPGGDIIEKFVGKDATHVIEVTHGKDVLKHRRPVHRNADIDELPQPYKYEPSAFGKQMLALHHKLMREGYYDNSFLWFLVKFSVPVCLNLTTFFLLFNHGDVFIIQLICSAFLGLFFHQSGFLMHDLMHSHAFQNYKLDEKFGVFYGTLCFGISARWWKDEHIVHHALTNTVEYSTGFIDPQAKEDVWAQNEKLFPFMKDKLQHFLIKVQYFTFVPLCVFVGRFGIVVDSIREEKRRDVLIAFALHCIWMGTMLSFVPSWKHRFLIYYFASVGEGVLHVQLLMNHYSKQFYEKETMHKTEYFQAMVECNINILCPRWMDWFHGGLNFHIEHHCFPRLPRNRYREVSPMIKKICQENGIVFDECSFTSALKRTLAHLKSISDIFEATRAYEPASHAAKKGS